MSVTVPLSFVPSWKQNYFSNSPLGPYHTLFFGVQFFSWGCLCRITCSKAIHQNIVLQIRVVLLICEYMTLGFSNT